ncbi:MBL fold metallo-hydrolase [Calothrix sp. UHCC 0171]|uniref:MBL fold metallo-hydrolase n=1 Tax=Calothrix sp. UHCC 0171 TaxID=3110245 RepID=UPI002B217E74|nr:MBL fold metallo-hydrolase [Calothrix sp. UHCC 0171]MEA5573719.1 MBL fold metallo-hydrolase [Calothrix sp. UHCC 0171]
MKPVKVKFFQAGYCTHPEAIAIRDGKWKISQFPAVFALILHPEYGAILYDTGYSELFYQESKDFPYRLYALTTPVYFQPEESAAKQLQKFGISVEEVNYIIISHFHADHIGGLCDFPNAQFICFQSGYTAVKNLRGIAATKAGFLPGLLPINFEQRAIFVEQKSTVALPPEYDTFDTGFDLFGDRSLIAVELPGHVTGQLGLFFTDTDKQSYFLIADACWLSRAYQEFIQPHPLASLIFASKRDYIDTLKRVHELHKLNPSLNIIPTHCSDAWRKLSNLKLTF